MQESEWKALNVKLISCPKCGVVGGLAKNGRDRHKKYYRVDCAACERKSSELQLMQSERLDGLGVKLKVTTFNRVGICAGCGAKNVRLVKHHWWLWWGETKKYTKMICERCNALPSLANGTHILPRWEEQLVMIAHDYREEVEFLQDITEFEAERAEGGSLGTTLLSDEEDEELGAAFKNC